MKTDLEIQADVEEELIWTPEVESSGIAVKVNGGIVTLTGHVPDPYDKVQAECAAKRVLGVIGIANDIRVRSHSGDVPDDPEIARRVVEAIAGDLPRIAEHVQVIVRDAHVTLEGSVEWQWQRQRLEATARSIKGVMVVSNLLQIRPRVEAGDIQRRIEDAFRRSAEVDAKQIAVEAHGGEVTLRGAVHSLSEKDEAQRTAWSAPGVTRVVNEITVRPQMSA